MRSRLAVCQPLAFALAPTLLLAAQNAEHVPLGVLWQPLAWSVAGAAAVFGLAWLASGDRWRASLFTTLCLVVFFSYGHVHGALSALGAISKTRHIHYLLVALYGCGLLLGGKLILRGARDFQPVCRKLGVLGASLCCVALAQLTLGYDRAARPASSEFEQPVVMAAQLRQAARSPRRQENWPDIYYIILDGYARSDQLARHYGVDNSDFLEGLRQRGFFVADRSTSNYTLTLLSLASSLNMQYLDHELERVKPGARSGAMRQLIQSHRVGRTLQAAGYSYLHLNSNWGPTQGSQIADRSLPEVAPEFQMILASTTMLKPLISLRLVRPVGLGGHDLHRYTFDTLSQANTVGQSTPKLVFAHLICPHPPLSADYADSMWKKVTTDEKYDPYYWGDREGYRQRVEFCNQQVLRMVDALLASSRQPPIIVLQADHGSASTVQPNRDPRQQPEFIEERTAILNALLVPESMRDRFHASRTPVNTFRIILSELLGLDLPELPKHVYLSWYEQPFELVEVTSQVAVD